MVLMRDTMLVSAYAARRARGLSSTLPSVEVSRQ